LAFESEHAFPSRVQRFTRPLLLIAILLFVMWIVGGQSLWFTLNVMEFGELAVRPVYFEFLSGIVLATISLVRIDIRNRRSLAWWGARLFFAMIRQKGVIEEIPRQYFTFKSFRLSLPNFFVWQLTKVLIGTTFFLDVMFGMAVYGLYHGWRPSLEGIWTILMLPFITPPFEMGYANSRVIPYIPVLTLFAAPLMKAVGTRILLLVVITQLAQVATPSREELAGAEPLWHWRVRTLELIGAVVAFWAAANFLVPSSIDYNSRYVIAGLIAAGIVLTYYYAKDRAVADFRFVGRRWLRRGMALLLIALAVASVMAINNSIADARKVEWRGPYVAQQIAVNRYLAQLDLVKEFDYNFSVTPVPPDRVERYVEENRDVLSRARLWDWAAAFAKLKPEIGLIPYVDFQDSDILRFNGTLYWSASMTLITPPAVRPEDRWYVQHFYYTHVPNGFLLLDAHDGKVVDSSRFFDERRVYYGEGGLFKRAWAAYPLERTKSDELGGVFYNGDGGIDLQPPLSWAFDSNFFWAYKDRAMHVMRYRDVYERMTLLLPFFEYEFGTKPVDVLPVTGGGHTYYTFPLIVKLETRHVPWSVGNPLFRLVGYALVDVYTGKPTVILLGDDFFTDLFKIAYKDYIATEVPAWLRNQLRYPEELFHWRVSMYNFYHVKDPATFIVGRDFFEIPANLGVYYVMEKPPGFEKPEFVGLLSLELRGAGGRNLAGYMVVRNDYPGTGGMIFYTVPIQAKTKLLGPTAVIEALEKNSDFAKLRTLLRQPRVGDNILYRVGDQDVYIIPVYTAGAGGVISELGVVACVGAAFTGETFVGLGSSAEEAFRNYLAQLSGVKRVPTTPEKTIEERKQEIIRLFAQANLTIVEPAALSPNLSISEGKGSYLSAKDWNATRGLILSFIDRWGRASDKIVVWSDESKTNFGVLVNVRGVVELHFISITLK